VAKRVLLGRRRKHNSHSIASCASAADRPRISFTEDFSHFSASYKLTYEKKKERIAVINVTAMRGFLNNAFRMEIKIATVTHSEQDGWYVHFDKVLLFKTLWINHVFARLYKIWRYALRNGYMSQKRNR